MRIYTGIGSRKTPDTILNLMSEIGLLLNKHDWILRSGGAEGADSAFEKYVNSKKEIYLPWKNFNNRNDQFCTYKIPEWACETVEKFHPYPNNLSYGAKNLMARNGMQVLGMDGNIKSDLIICWTPGGGFVGGTSQALRIAQYHKIPIMNLADVTPELDIEFFEDFIENRKKIID